LQSAGNSLHAAVSRSPSHNTVLKIPSEGDRYPKLRGILIDPGPRWHLIGCPENSTPAVFFSKLMMLNNIKRLCEVNEADLQRLAPSPSSSLSHTRALCLMIRLFHNLITRTSSWLNPAFLGNLSLKFKLDYWICCGTNCTGPCQHSST
jgi:hypothetical protein